MIREYVLLYSPNKNADYPSIVSLPNDRSRKDRLMKRRKLIALSAVFVTAIATLLISSQSVLVSAQNASAGAQKGDREEAPPPFYNPYPPGILPADLNSEIARVQREVDGIEAEALEQWHAVTPPILTGQPPTLQNTGVQSIEILGKLMNFDKHISTFQNEACGFCHMPYAAFSGPIPSVNLTMIAYPGTFRFRAGKRTAPRYTYSPDFPVLELDPALVMTTPPAATLAAFFGGNFWDGRSTGYKLQSADAEQAPHPPVDTQEMGFADTACIAFRISQAVYRPLFEEVWGAGSLDIKFPNNTESICEIPGGASVFGTNVQPIPLKPEDRTKADRVYGNWGQPISFFERSVNVSAFSSKFDAFLAGNYTMTPNEMAGYNLFKGKANCTSCHLDGRSTAPSPTAPGSTGTGTAASTRPLG